jgi:GTP-binding protein EngB required for normal cell division
MSYMGESEIPFCIIFTKADKISKVKINSHIAAYKKNMFANNWAEMPQYFVTSATESLGKKGLKLYRRSKPGSLEQQSVLNSYFLKLIWPKTYL